MSGRPKAAPVGKNTEITILLVDDIPEARENIKKLLAFEQDFRVIGSAGTGREGVSLAKELQPDIIVMDINMPDMDGLEATNIINKAVPTSAVIIMSVQNDPDYMRRALRAGARDFLTKPVNMDELYSTIRTVYRNHEAVREQYRNLETLPLEALRASEKDDAAGNRAGHIIAVYSPQGGAGTTTIATSLASSLMKEDIKVLLVDADLQFADIGTFLNLQSPTSIVELVEDVDDLDIDLFENIVATHNSGLKVLMGPGRPEYADTVTADPNTLRTILEKIRSNYDFIVVDTSTNITETLLGVFEIASRILLIVKPTLVSVKNMRFVVDLFDQLEFDPNRHLVAINQVWDERKGKTPTIPTEKISTYLHRTVIGAIPLADERILLSAINKGVPVIATDKDQSRPPVRQLLEMGNAIFDDLMGVDEEDMDDLEGEPKKRGGLAGILGR